MSTSTQSRVHLHGFLWPNPGHIFYTTKVLDDMRNNSTQWIKESLNTLKCRMTNMCEQTCLIQWHHNPEKKRGTLSVACPKLWIISQFHGHSKDKNMIFWTNIVFCSVKLQCFFPNNWKTTIKMLLHLLMWVEEFHKPSPSHHRFFKAGMFTIPSHGWWKWHCFTHIIPHSNRYKMGWSSFSHINVPYSKWLNLMVYPIIIPYHYPSSELWQHMTAFSPSGRDTSQRRWRNRHHGGTSIRGHNLPSYHHVGVKNTNGLWPFSDLWNISHVHNIYIYILYIYIYIYIHTYTYNLWNYGI